MWFISPLDQKTDKEEKTKKIAEEKLLHSRKEITFFKREKQWRQQNRRYQNQERMHEHVSCISSDIFLPLPKLDNQDYKNQYDLRKKTIMHTTLNPKDGVLVLLAKHCFCGAIDNCFEFRNQRAEFKLQSGSLRSLTRI